MSPQPAPPVTQPRCPDCRSALDGSAACPACGLRLTGPSAQRLWEVDLALAALEEQRGPLLVERGGLLTALRSAALPSAAHLPAPVRPPAPEAAPRSVQNVLLGLGGLLLAVAATVFAAVTYERLGAGGRAAVLLALTVASATAAPVLLRRRLPAGAETAVAVTLVLTLLDAAGLRTLGVGDGLSPSAYAASATAVLAALALAYGRLVPLRTAVVAGPVLGNLAVLLAVQAADTSAGGAAVVLVGLAAADLLLLAALSASPVRPAPGLRPALRALGLVAAAASLLTALLGAALEERAASLALLLLAALAVGAASVAGGLVRALLAAAPVPLVALAAWGLLRPELADTAEPLVATVTALLAALVGVVLPRGWRRGPLVGAAAVTAVALLTQVEAVLQALLGPAAWLAQPWTLRTTGAREALTPLQVWDGSAVTLAVVAGSALVLGASALAVRSSRSALVLAAVPAAGSVALVPLALSTSYATALVLLVGVTAALVAAALLPAAALRLPERDVPVTGDRRAALLALAAPLALLAGTWSAADRTATLTVLPVLAVLAAAAACRPGRHAAASTAAAGLLAAVALGSAGAARGLSAEQVGGALVLVVAGLVALPLARPRRAAAEGAAVVVAAACLVLSAGDPGWLSWCLAGLGLVALGGALHADRRLLAPAGALLLSASSWVRLVDAGVGAPEPYVVPLGLLALGLGHLRRRQVPSTGSVPAYGPGLSALLLPSLLAALSGDALLRPLLLGLAALVVLLVGARTRLRAPLALGGAVLAVDVLHLLTPYAAALPRWLPLALTGLLLVGLGATYEQRRRDLGRLRDRFAALA